MHRQVVQFTIELNKFYISNTNAVCLCTLDHIIIYYNLFCVMYLIFALHKGKATGKVNDVSIEMQSFFFLFFLFSIFNEMQKMSYFVNRSS